jgi:DNA-binding transcriptional LysR family regulator
MLIMRLEKLRQVDLNLLIIFAVIAEEGSVTKAAARLLLSQPAVSRALQRARTMFRDDLLVRSPSGFELTLRGRKILQELEKLLPKIEGVVIPSVFRKGSGAISAFPARTMFASRCCRAYAADIKTTAIG